MKNFNLLLKHFGKDLCLIMLKVSRTKSLSEPNTATCFLRDLNPNIKTSLLSEDDFSYNQMTNYEDDQLQYISIQNSQKQALAVLDFRIRFQ